MPLKDAVSYVAAAYIAVFLIVLIYVAIIAVRVRRTERELSELLQREGP
jgi:CcmD family protein